MSENSTQVTASIPDGKAIKIVDTAKEEKPYFHLIGTGDKRRGAKTDPIDFIQVLTEMSKPELFVIGTIKDKVGYNDRIGEAYIPTSMFNPAELQKWKRGLGILKSKKLVCTTKQSHFMIHPNAYIPQKYTEALVQWNKVMTKGDTSKSSKVVEQVTDTLPYDYPESREELYEEVVALPYDYPLDE